MAFEMKQLGVWALWVLSIASAISGITFLSGYGGDLVSSLLGVGLEGFVTLQGILGVLGIMTLWMMRR